MIELHDTSLAEREDAAWIEAGRDIYARDAEFSRRLDGIAWESGDWINARPVPHGQLRVLAREIGFDEGTLRNRKWVAARIPLSRRRDTLSWSHHEAVAKLDDGDADALLAAAETYSWPVRRMRDEAAEASTEAKLKRAQAENAALRDRPADAQAALDVIGRSERRLKSAASQLKAIYAEMADILEDPELRAATAALHGNARRALAPRFQSLIARQEDRCTQPMNRITGAIAAFEAAGNCHDTGTIDGIDGAETALAKCHDAGTNAMTNDMPRPAADPPPDKAIREASG